MAALTDEQAYRDHERSVLAMLATRYRDLDPDGRRELYHEAWASVLKRRRDGVEVESLRAYLLGAADKLASKRVYGADARRRQTFDPNASGFAAVADIGEQPDELVLAADEARRVRMFIDELGEAEQALFKLRLDLGLEPHEIRERLGLTGRQYRRTAERAGKALLEQFRAFDRGEWARGKRSLLCACVMGIASDAQRERARRLVDEDPCCRAMMSELRELGGNAAAVLPLPAGAAAAGSGHGGDRLTELFADLKSHVADAASRVASGPVEGRGANDVPLGTFSNVRRQAGETLMGAKQHATSAYVRVADPTPLTGARPGAAAAILASCVAAGGGAYCAVEGVPEGLRAPVGLDRSQADTSPASDPVDRGAEDRPSPTPPPPVLPADPPAQQQPASNAPLPADPAQAPERSAAPAPPPPVPENEFEPTRPTASPEAPASAAPAPSKPATPAPAQGGSGEFSP